MIILSVDQIKQLHETLINETGGVKGIRDEGILEACLENIYQPFFGEKRYKTIEEKAARLCYSWITSHGFIDGNKRIGIYAMLVFLELNGLVLMVSDSVLIDLGFKEADGTMNYDSVLEVLLENTESLEL